MQNKLAEPDNFISLWDIARIIVKRKKTLLWTTVVLFLLSAAVIFITYKHKVTYQQTITLPYFYSGASEIPVLDITQTVAYVNAEVLPVWLEHYREAQLAAGKPILVNAQNYMVSSFKLDGVKGPMLSPLIISLSYKTTREEKLARQTFKSISMVIQSAIQDYMRLRLSSYMTDAKNKISQLESQIPILEKDKDIEQNVKQKNGHQTSDVNIQTMRDLYLAAVSDKDQYNMLFKVQTNLVVLKKNLQTLTKTLTVGNVVVLPDLTQQGRWSSLILSLFISLFIGFIAVFIAEFTANLNK
jgi:hypothetical protein